MLDQLDDGSHEITLHNICCQGCEPYSKTTGILKWDIEEGITYTLTFNDTLYLDNRFYSRARSYNPGVGRLSSMCYTSPMWTAKTDDGTEVQLFGVIEESDNKSFSGTFGAGCSFCITGTAMYAVVEIPCNRMLAFDGVTVEPYRLFFNGNAGECFLKTEDITFRDINGASHGAMRCSSPLSQKVSLVDSSSFVKCTPSGWLAFSEAPTQIDCEVPAIHEQSFVSFLNGKKVAFHWSDRRLVQGNIRRVYYGWVKSKPINRNERVNYPLPFMDKAEAGIYGAIVLSHLPDFFQQYILQSQHFNISYALNPLWTSYDGVLDDELALACISLERTANMWKLCKNKIIKGDQQSKTSIWKRKPLLKSLRKSLLKYLEILLGRDKHVQKYKQRLLGQLVKNIKSHIYSKPDELLSAQEKDELFNVLSARINNLTSPPNSNILQQPFKDLHIPLSEQEQEAIKQRNKALHGNHECDSSLEFLDQSVEYFDSLRVLLTKFFLKLCDYKGPIH